MVGEPGRAGWAGPSGLDRFVRLQRARSRFRAVCFGDPEFSSRRAGAHTHDVLTICTHTHSRITFLPLVYYLFLVCSSSAFFGHRGVALLSALPSDVYMLLRAHRLLHSHSRTVYTYPSHSHFRHSYSPLTIRPRQCNRSLAGPMPIPSLSESWTRPHTPGFLSNADIAHRSRENRGSLLDVAQPNPCCVGLVVPPC